MAAGYAKGSQDFTLPQCAGAAIFRANTGWADEMPIGFHELPADRETVYADPAQLIAGREGVSELVARSILLFVTPEKMCRAELEEAARLGCKPIDPARR
jgi:hypothetical protein